MNTYSSCNSSQTIASASFMFFLIPSPLTSLDALLHGGITIHQSPLDQAADDLAPVNYKLTLQFQSISCSYNHIPS